MLNYASDRHEHSCRDTIAFLAHEHNLSEDERKERLPSGRMSIFDNRIRIASFPKSRRTSKSCIVMKFRK